MSESNGRPIDRPSESAASTQAPHVRQAPPRPRVRITPLPLPRVTPPPPPLRAAQLLWFGSFTVYLGLALFTAMRWNDVTRALVDASRLENEARALPYTDQDLADAVNVALFGTGGAGLALVLLELLLLRAVIKRNLAARFWLALLGAASIGTAYLLGSILQDSATATNDAVVWAPVGQGVLVIAATLMMYAPQTTYWMRTGGEAAPAR